MEIKNERETFEKLPEIAKRLNVATYSEDLGFYHAAVLNSGHTVAYVQGAWMAWQAKSKAVPEKDAVIKKLSDQLYAQEMKASAARVLCETACELLDGYAHQDAMVILNDLEQAMIEAQEQSHEK